MDLKIKSFSLCALIAVSFFLGPDSVFALTCSQSFTLQKKTKFVNHRQLIDSFSIEQRVELEDKLGYEFEIFNSDINIGELFLAEYFTGTPEEYEDAPVVVANHGFTHNSDTFNSTLFFSDPQVKSWLEEGYRVILPDLPGRGRSLVKSLETFSEQGIEMSESEYVRMYNEKYQSEFLFLSLYSSFGIGEEEWKRVLIGGHSQGAIDTLYTAKIAKRWLKHSRFAQPVILLTPYLVYLSDVYEQDFVDRMGGALDIILEYQSTINDYFKKLKEISDYQLSLYTLPFRFWRRAFGFESSESSENYVSSELPLFLARQSLPSTIFANFSKRVANSPAISFTSSYFFRYVNGKVEGGYMDELLAKIIDKFRRPEVDKDTAILHAKLSLYGVRDFNGFGFVRELIDEGVGVRLVAGDEDHALAPFFIMLALHDYLVEEFTSAPEKMQKFSLELVPASHYITADPALVIAAFMGLDLPEGKESRNRRLKLMFSVDPSSMSPFSKSLGRLGLEGLGEKFDEATHDRFEAAKALFTRASEFMK